MNAYKHGAPTELWSLGCCVSINVALLRSICHKPRKRRLVTGESSLSAEDICQRLTAGDSPRDIAKAAGVSHQRIYFIAKQAGLGVRARKAKISSRVIQFMPKPPTE